MIKIYFNLKNIPISLLTIQLQKSGTFLEFASIKKVATIL